MADELMERLAAARPNTPSDVLQPDTELLDEILTARRRRRVVTPVRLAAVASLAAALVAALLIVPRADTATLNMQAIAESTTSAMNSGRAHVVMVTRTTKQNPRAAGESGADFTVEFNGDNRSMYGTIDPGDPCVGADVSIPDERCGSQPFPIANRVVDGQFYLQDGTRWVEDTNASNMAGTDIFSVDPRNFLAGVAQAAAFEQVDEANGTRHLRATKLDAIPEFNLGLGPRGDTALTTFELWVDDADVVRAIRVSTKQTEESYAGARARLVKDPDGTMRKEIDPATLGEPTTVTITQDYKVTFSDLGEDIPITAPPGAVQIAGKG